MKNLLKRQKTMTIQRETYWITRTNKTIINSLASTYQNKKGKYFSKNKLHKNVQKNDGRQYF